MASPSSIFSPTATMTPSQQSKEQVDGQNDGAVRITAASRVFQIPELLHLILMEMPTQSYTIMERDKVHRILRPAIDLFWLQRVNHTFLNCIHKAQLQQRMTVSKMCPDPVVWFAHFMRLKRNSELIPFAFQPRIAFIKLDLIHVSYGQEMLIRNKKREGPDASWRKWPVSYTVKTLFVLFCVRYHPRRESPFDYQEFLRLEAGADGATLGHVYEAWMKLMKRTEYEHCMAQHQPLFGDHIVIYHDHNGMYDGF